MLLREVGHPENTKQRGKEVRPFTCSELRTRYREMLLLPHLCPLVPETQPSSLWVKPVVLVLT